MILIKVKWKKSRYIHFLIKISFSETGVNYAEQIFVNNKIIIWSKAYFGI